jgi:hypothetical protein
MRNRKRVLTVWTSTCEAAFRVDADSAGAKSRIDGALVDVLTSLPVELGHAGWTLLAVNRPVALLARTAPCHAHGATTLSL